MKDGIKLFNSLKVVNKATKEDKTNNLKCIDGWINSLKSMISIWKTLYEDGTVSYLVTRQLNQDPLENFFGSIRQQGGNSDNPTPIQFKRAYRKLFHTNLLRISTGNCEEDTDQPLTKLSSLQEIQPLNITKNNSPLNIISSDYAKKDVESKLVKENALSYVAGYLLKRTFEKHVCGVCKSLLVDNESNDPRKNLLFQKAYSLDNLFGGLVAPSEFMIAFIIRLEDIFVEYFRGLKKTKGMGSDLLHLMDKESFKDDCNKIDKQFLLMLFIRLRIYYCIKFGNRELASGKRKSRKYLKVVHL